MIPPAEIRAIRERLAMSQVTFGRLLGVFWTTVSRWECGHRAPSAHDEALIRTFGNARAAETIGQEVMRLLDERGVGAALYLVLKYSLEPTEELARRTAPKVAAWAPPPLPSPPPGVVRTNPRAHGPAPLPRSEIPTPKRQTAKAKARGK